MKINMFHTLLILLLAFSCKEKDLKTNSLCENSCNGETILEELNNVSAKIIEVCTTRDESGNYTNCIYAISTDEAWLDKKTWPEPSDNILVPCNGIPEEFQKVNQKVIISGLKRSCCNLLTKPEFRASFGCKFEITAIEKSDGTSKDYLLKI